LSDLVVESLVDFKVLKHDVYVQYYWSRRFYVARFGFDRSL